MRMHMLLTCICRSEGAGDLWSWAAMIILLVCSPLRTRLKSYSCIAYVQDSSRYYQRSKHECRFLRMHANYCNNIMCSPAHAAKDGTQMDAVCARAHRRHVIRLSAKRIRNAVVNAQLVTSPLQLAPQPTRLVMMDISHVSCTELANSHSLFFAQLCS